MAKKVEKSPPVLKGTQYKGMELSEAITQHRDYFEKLMRGDEWVNLSSADRSNIKKYLGYKNSSAELYRNRTDVQDLIADLKKGYSYQYIRDSKIEDGMDPQIFTTLFSTAKSLIVEEYARNKETLVAIHIARYEKIYNDNINPELGHLKLPANVIRAIKLDHWTVAMEALLAKERVLGFHSKSFKLQINNIKRDGDEIEYDYIFNQLKLKELIRLKELLKLTKVSEENEESEFSFIGYANSFDDESEESDSSYEEIPIVSVPPVQQIKETTPPEKPIEGKTLDEVKDQMKESLRLKLLETLKKKHLRHKLVY